jgi:thiol-disulfide isomerase/thioredoxin
MVFAGANVQGPTTSSAATSTANGAGDDAIRTGRDVLAQVTRAYAEAPALRDTVTLDMNGPMGKQTQQITVGFQGRDLRVAAPSLNITVVNGVMFVQNPAATDVYVELPVAGDPVKAMQGVFPFVPPQLLVRSVTDPALQLQAWTFGLLQEPEVAGHSIKVVNGVRMHEIALKATVGLGNLLVNAETNLVEKAFVHVSPPGAPDDSDVTGTLTFTPVISEKLDRPIAFDISGKEKVAGFEHLAPTLRNKPAPDFALETLEGEVVRLADLKGQVVVLDFWATWCGPCKRGLPLLQKFADGVQAEGKPVKVFAVNTMEHDPPEQSRPAIDEYWRAQKFTIPTLLDLKKTLPGPYLIQSIPLTLVIDREGTVRKVHLGFDPDMVEHLQRDVNALLDAPGG